jgi:hypothetical protein
LSQNTDGLVEAYGPDTPARRILVAVYFAILVTSIGLLTTLLFTNRHILPIALTLLTLQVTYKVSTAFVLDLNHPVVVANLIISAVHATTLAVLLR